MEGCFFMTHTLTRTHTHTRFLIPFAHPLYHAERDCLCVIINMATLNR